MILLFAYVSLLVLLGLIMFQVALILGVPLGRYAWGGQNDRLPTKLRAASVISIILYVLFGAFMASRAGVAGIIKNDEVLAIGMWAFTIYFFVGIAMNAMSRSKPERYFMTPIAAVLAISFAVVTLYT